MPFASGDRSTELEGVRDALIMLVDDEPLTIEVIRTLLEEGGYKHFVATSESVRVMEMLADRRPDILLLDLMMPEMNGFEILSRMQIENVLKDVPVIVLTSSQDPTVKLKALELGATDFLAKPVDPSELVLRMGNTLLAKVYRDRLANYDALTGTPNRSLFMDRIERALRLAESWHRDTALLHVGLDDFARVNTELGPRIGDAVLQRVAHRLRNCIRTTDTVLGKGEGPQASVSRFAGDEFNFLLPLVRESRDAARFAERVLLAVATPFPLADQQLALTCSIGISLFSRDGRTGDLLMRNAAIAMQQAKAAGKNTFRFYSAEPAGRVAPQATEGGA